ncbi:hypothetical protein [Streptomyces sp. SP18CS02]|uniref:hypothetical protein n=1 Tax=Streptomyces sp. SP18CS02 TaxID=3002531 RepID=UPI002E79F36F|nr:hypothetical protein [Streptomyces sp. SP18CS02]MEE1754592.1 hypothetical protein [Streptomyces sp. SP18CS02]
MAGRGRYVGSGGDGIPEGTDLTELLAVRPEQLRRHPRLLYARRAGEAAALARAYARGGTSRTYDDIAFRHFSACPPHPFGSVETLAGLAVARERGRNLRLPDDLARLAGQHVHLAHRRLVVPDGEFRYGIRNGLVHSTSLSGDTVDVFPLWAPSRSLEGAAEDSDVMVQPTGRLSRLATDSRWLPLAELVAAGRFPVMREAAPLLSRGTAPGHHYVFVSHRWLSTREPDPDGEQARAVAWHLFGALCEAVRIAHERGLHTPRRYLGALRAPVGPAGSDLVESLLVGLLRPTLGEEGLAEAAAEAERIEEHVADLGAGQARGDTGLAFLRGLLPRLPALRALVGRVRLWYDYSCVPQAPRTDAEQRLFERTMRGLPLLQTVARTLIVLDDTADYLSRAWCHLEASTALLTTFSDRPDVLATPHYRDRPDVPDPEALDSLLRDRRLVVWRGLLDTELFGFQTPAECLRRLGLSMTDPNDLDHIYDALLAAPPPLGRLAQEALVTGAFPLPDTGDRGFLAPSPEYRPSQPVGPAPRGRVLGSLDWREGIDARRAARARATSGVPSYWSLPASGGSRPACHVAVVAECEGEALLISSWVRGHLQELAGLLGVTVVSGSWTSVDPVPVGHLPDGTLRGVAVKAQVWAVVGKSHLVRNDLGQTITELASEAGVPTVAVHMDLEKDNVRVGDRNAAPPEQRALLVSAPGGPPVHRHGLLHMHLFRHLLQSEAPVA